MKMFDEEVLELHELFDGLVENNLSIKQKARLQFLLEKLFIFAELIGPSACQNRNIVLFTSTEIIIQETWVFRGLVIVVINATFFDHSESRIKVNGFRLIGIKNTFLCNSK